MVGEHSYTALPTPGHIRLLTLKASKSKFADLHGELVDYPLQECDGDMHCYEALSYVWGDDKKPRHIWIGTRKLYITESLYAALLRLRSHYADRSLWVDAICINQMDDAEKSVQVQRMSTVYSKASRVKVWLGEYADGSDAALYSLADAGADEGPHEVSRGSLEPLRKLLARDWFKRIWVLQEVAAAQHVVLVCGGTSIDGYAFCMGLQVLHKSGKLSDLQNHVGSIVYLIRRSIFRLSKQTRQPSQEESPMSSLNIQPLGQLIDMYRNRKATDQRDKVYALLGMCSGDIPEDLLPNYSDDMTWDGVLGNLAQYVFGVKANVEVVATDIAAIRIRGRILGHVSSIGPDEHRYDMHVLAIKSHHTDWHYREESEWIVPTSAVPVQPKDIICLLEGGQNIAILRLETDFLSVITTSGRWQTGSVPQDQDQDKISEYELLLIWDWTPQTETTSRFPNLLPAETTFREMGTPARHQNVFSGAADAYMCEKTESTLLKLEKLYQQQPTGTSLDELDRAAQNVYILLRVGRRHEAEERYEGIYRRARAAGMTAWLSQSIMQYLRLFRYIDSEKKQVWDILASILIKSSDALLLYLDIHGKLAYVFQSMTMKSAKLLIDLGEILDPNLDTADLMATGQEDNMIIVRGKIKIAEERVVRLAAKNLWHAEEMMDLLFKERGDRVPVTEDVAVAAATNRAEVIKLLFEKRGDQVPITEKVVKAAAENQENGLKVLELLFETRGDHIPIPESVAEAASGNRNGQGSGRKLMEMLLQKRSDHDLITEDVVIAAATNHPEVMELFFKQRGDQVTITENVAEAAARNSYYGLKVMELLFEKRGDQVPITENVITAAAENWNRGWELFFEKRGDQILITENVVMAAATNCPEAMELLFERRGDQILITENVVMAAATNFPEAMELLFEKRGDQVTITEKVTEAAAGNGYYGLKVMELLFEKRGNQVPITENVITAAAGNWKFDQEIIKLLFEKGKDVATLSAIKYMALEGAAISGSSEEVKLLLLEKVETDAETACWSDLSQLSQNEGV